MVWQVLAMWTIVIVTIIWFVRDEKRLRREAEIAESVRYYAHARKFRSAAAEAVPALRAAPRTGGLTSTQRQFLHTLQQQR